MDWDFLPLLVAFMRLTFGSCHHDSLLVLLQKLWYCLQADTTSNTDSATSRFLNLLVFSRQSVLFWQLWVLNAATSRGPSSITFINLLGLAELHQTRH